LTARWCNGARSRSRQGIGAAWFHHQQQFAAEPLPKKLSSLQVIETPTPKFLTVNVQALTTALLDYTIAMPSIDGVERATESALWYSDLDYEREAAFITAGFCCRADHG
jgi:hypothetical protein